MGVKGKRKRIAGKVEQQHSSDNSPQKSIKKTKTGSNLLTNPTRAANRTKQSTNQLEAQPLTSSSSLCSPTHSRSKDKHSVYTHDVNVTSPFHNTPQQPSQHSTPAKTPKTPIEAKDMGLDSEYAKTVLKGGQKWKTLIPMLHNAARLTYGLDEFPSIENFGPVLVALARLMVDSPTSLYQHIIYNITIRATYLLTRNNFRGFPRRKSDRCI